MEPVLPALSRAEILLYPAIPQLKVAAEWLFQHPEPNLDLEVALNRVLTGQSAPADSGGFWAIAHTSPSPLTLTPQQVYGVAMASPNNRNVSLAGSDRAITQRLLAQVQARGSLYRVVVSQRSRDWLKPLMLQHYHLEREYTSLIMQCADAPPSGEGRWATPRDKPALQAYIEAVSQERGLQISQPDWDMLIQQRRVAVLDHQKQVVSVTKRGSTVYEGVVLGMFTFAPFRQQGFAKRLLAFSVSQMLQDYPAVKLWVDDDNHGAIALYRSLGFRPVGALYIGYFQP